MTFETGGFSAAAVAVWTCPAATVLSAQRTGADRLGTHVSREPEAKVTPGVGAESLDLATTGPACTPGPSTHCLATGRFKTQVTWQLPGGGTGPGLTAPLTSHSGGFYFFSPGDLDLVAKVVESPQFFEVHYSGLSTVMYALTVTDTTTGCIRTYFNPQGMSSTVGDLEAFPNPALPCEIFSDGFETGDVSAWSLVVG